MRSFNREAHKKFREKVASVGGWFCYNGLSGTLDLDGQFTISELRLLADALEEYLESEEEKCET